MKDRIVGVISDTHIPGHIKNALEFCQDTFNDYKVTEIVHIGDLCDHHYISFHNTEPEAMNPVQEFKSARKEIARWVAAFPNVKLCIGNHDTIPARQARIPGMPKDIFLRSLNDIYELPDTWRWAVRWDIDKVIYEHGTGSAGMYGCKNTALKIGSSFVQGHTHSNAGVYDLPQARTRMAAMNVGCLMDENKYFAKYAKIFYKTRISIGCGVVFARDEMKFIPKR